MQNFNWMSRSNGATQEETAWATQPRFEDTTNRCFAEQQRDHVHLSGGFTAEFTRDRPGKFLKLGLFPLYVLRLHVQHRFIC